MDKKFILNQILLITTSFLAFGMEDPNPQHNNNAKRKKEELTTINNLSFKKLKIEEEDEAEEHDVGKIKTEISSEEEENEEINFQDNSDKNNNIIISVQELPPHLMPLVLSFIQKMSNLDKHSNKQSTKILDTSINQTQSRLECYLCDKNINRLPWELTQIILKFIICDKIKNSWERINDFDLRSIDSDKHAKKLSEAIDPIWKELENYLKSLNRTVAFKDILPESFGLNILAQKIIEYISTILKEYYQAPKSILRFMNDIYKKTDKYQDLLFRGCISAHERDLTGYPLKKKIKGITIKFKEGPYLLAYALEKGFKRLVKLLIERKALQILIDRGLSFLDVFGFSDPYDCIDTDQNFHDNTFNFLNMIALQFYTQPIMPLQNKSMRRHQKLIQKISDEFKKSKAKS